MRFRFLIYTTLTLAGLLIGIALADATQSENDDPRSRKILDRAAELSRSTRDWRDRRQELGLQITDRRGGVRERSLEMWTKRQGKDSSRTILFFREPPQARGVGFLQWVDADGPDRQWLYLPSSKRVRQITGSRKKESFVGTDFSYEDLGLMMEVVRWGVEDANSTLLREEDLEGVSCAVLRLVPTPKQDVSYGEMRLWVGLGDFLVRRYDFLDADGVVLKTLRLKDIRQVDGIPAPHELRIFNVDAGSHTVAVVRSLQFNTGLDDDAFTKRRLERGG